MRLGDTAPDFIAETTHGTIRFHQWKAGTWAVLFSYCRDFAHRCTTELGTLAALLPEFQKRNAKIIGLSVEPLDALCHMAGDCVGLTGRAITFPIIADRTRAVARCFGIADPHAGHTMPAHFVFLIGPANTVKLVLSYPASIRPNFSDLPRIIDCLEIAAHHDGVASVDRPGSEHEVFTPVMSGADSRPNGSLRSGTYPPACPALPRANP